MFSARVVLASKYRARTVTTLEVTMPRIVLAEFNTHRMFSRNSASSRAIPFERNVAKVVDEPFLPVHWGANQPGMKADAEIPAELIPEAMKVWLSARDSAVAHAQKLHALGVHKQVVNRLIEPWMWHTVIVTATEWENFYQLRCHPAAQPEMRHVAELMSEAMIKHVPLLARNNEWHLPYVGLVADPTAANIAESVSACARVSYARHAEERSYEQNIKLATALLNNGHMSPFEHQARPSPGKRSGNFVGWEQLRHSTTGKYKLMNDA